MSGRCPDCGIETHSEGAAPLPDWVPVERLARAVHRVDHGGDFDTCLRPDDDRHRAGLIAAFYARSRPSDERVPESEEPHSAPQEGMAE